MWQIFSESSGRCEWCSPGFNWKPVLSLRTLSKILRVHQGQLPPARGPLQWRVIRTEPVEFIRLTLIKIWLSGGKAQHKSHGALEALRTSLTLKLYNSASPCVSLAPPELAQNSSKVFCFFFKEDCILGPGWLPPADFPAVCQLGRAGPQGVSRVGSVYLPG